MYVDCTDLTCVDCSFVLKPPPVKRCLVVLEFIVNWFVEERASVDWPFEGGGGGLLDILARASQIITTKYDV